MTISNENWFAIMYVIAIIASIRLAFNEKNPGGIIGIIISSILALFVKLSGGNNFFSNWVILVACFTIIILVFLGLMLLWDRFGPVCIVVIIFIVGIIITLVILKMNKSIPATISGNVLSYSEMNQTYKGEYNLEVKKDNVILLNLKLEGFSNAKEFRFENNQKFEASKELMAYDINRVFIYLDVFADNLKMRLINCQIYIPRDSNIMIIAISRNDDVEDLIYMTLEAPKRKTTWEFLYKDIRSIRNY